METPFAQIIKTLGDLVARRVGETTGEHLRFVRNRSFRNRLEALGVLSAGLAKDLNELLKPIAGWCELAGREIPPASPARTRLDWVRESWVEARALALPLSSFSRPVAESRQTMRVSSVIDRVVAWLRRARPLDVRDSKQTREASVDADPVQLHQLILNLCLNAAEAVDSDHGLVSVALDEVQLGEDASDAGEFCRGVISGCP